MTLYPAEAERTRWYDAIPLAERLARRNGATGESEGGEQAAQAARRLQRWQAQPPFTEAERFAQRLASDGLSEAAFLQALGESESEVASHFTEPPSWLVWLTRALARSPQRLRLPPTEREGALQLLQGIEPLISQALEQMQGEAWLLTRRHARASAPFDPKNVGMLFYPALLGALFEMVNRTMVLELNVARLRGELAGESSEARFQSFIRRLHQREGVQAILQEYPVLARQVVCCLEQWVTTSVEFLEHLCTDWPALRATFGIPASSKVVQVEAGGDRHGGGRSVFIIHFSSGLRLVYKPKSLRVDVHFQALLTWLNEHGATLPFRTLRVLDRGHHGWVEFAASADCESRTEVERFYERQGGYLALLHLLQATDFHFENLIAAGEHPILIDLESLFHPQPDMAETAPAGMQAMQVISYSVLRVGLLPQWMWAADGSAGIELSGLGGAGGQLSLSAVPLLAKVASDQMHVARERMPMPGAHNRPHLQGAEVDLLDYRAALLRGFADTYRLLARHRDALLAEDGPLLGFAQDEVRVILRPTRLYGVMLQESYHPDLLRHALDRDLLFDKLWLAVTQQPYLSRVIPAEREDMWQGDIPMFSTRPASRHLWTSRGQQLDNFFTESGLARTQRVLERMGEEELARQSWFVDASLSTLAMGAAHTPLRSYHPGEAGAPEPEACLQMARAIGDHLAGLAVWGESRTDATWLGLAMIDETHWILTPLGVDLYDGVTGVALFFAYLGELAGEPRYTELARAALATMRQQLDDHGERPLPIGVFNGLGGIIYGLTHLGSLWNDSTLLERAESLVPRLASLVANDDLYDLIGGAAGGIAGLLALYRQTASPQALDAARRCGEQLLRHAQPMEVGLGWPSKWKSGTPLTGFAHGAAGIAWALLALEGQTGDAQFRAGALAALAYERALFSTAHGNWPDLRDHGSSGSPTFMAAWCHGAPGIGLARLASLPYLDDETTRSEIEVALATTSTVGFGQNHSLCHGDLGNLELLLEASRVLVRPDLHTQTYRLGGAILRSIQEHGWLTGVPLGVETPGLMTGMAGMGYGLLRLADPHRIPSLLTLAPPQGFAHT